ncbi:glycosyltransferase [Pleurocapsales cyanobacterium LEGE 10410]|nr:glycosyltransferase [Pleurocapsales cyanobacterium LEGE 10410]
MNKLKPKVSVLMCVYNGEAHLRAALESILEQTFTDFEFVIVDDGSTDSSWQMLTEYSREDSRITLIRNQENIGLTKSLNKGLKLAEGEYIARQDADDVSFPERFEKQVAFLDRHSEVVLVSCDIERINAEGCPIGKFQRGCEPELVFWYLLFYNRLAGHSQVVFRRESVMNIDGYCENYRYSQDYELWCRLVETGKILILPKVLLQQRFHSQRVSAAKKLEQREYTLAQVKHNIQKLVGEEISLEEAEDLMGFWIGHWRSQCFPDSRKAQALDSRLKQIRQSFTECIKDSVYYNLSDSEISNRLDTTIGQQFLYWIQAPLTRQHGAIAKLRVSLTALAWKPWGIPHSWLIGLGKSALSISRSLAKKISQTIPLILHFKQACFGK